MYSKTRLCNPILAISIWACPASAETPAMDMHRARQIAEAIELHTTPDEAIRLEASGIEFRGLYRDAVSKDLRGGVILLHGRHSSQDSANLIHPLRQGLPEHGWSSLSLAMPIAEPDDLQGHAARLEEAIERLQSAVTFFTQKNLTNIALLAHDTGTWAALGYLARSPDSTVKAAVLVDPVPIPDLDPSPIAADRPSFTGLPILEILSSRLSSPADDMSRKRAAMKNNPAYRLLVLNEPDRGWQDMEDFLINRIHGWLTSLQMDPAKRSKSNRPNGAYRK